MRPSRPPVRAQYSCPRQLKRRCRLVAPPGGAAPPCLATLSPVAVLGHARWALRSLVRLPLAVAWDTSTGAPRC
eukprot:2521595-Alexandrium_andersonii.AAC.1